MTTSAKPTIEVVPSGATLGAEIRGLDVVRGPSHKVKDLIVGAIAEHLFVVLRGQRLNDEELVEFGSRFGSLHIVEHNEYDRQANEDQVEIEIISNVVEAGVPIGSLGAGVSAWHTDMSMYEVPAWLSILHAHEISGAVSRTKFANMYAAYETLPEALRRKVEGRTAIHAVAYLSGGQLRPGYEAVTDVSKGAGARHPVVRTHPATGRKALYLGRRRYGYILGLPVEESEALLDQLWEHMSRPEHTVEHEWRVGDLVIWDNRCTIHGRDAFDPSARRTMNRVTVLEDMPI